MITCCVRYVLAPGRAAEFEEYARRWVALIEKFGGTHHGVFMPDAPDVPRELSFAIGAEGPGDVAMVLYSFPDAAAYAEYRRLAAEDPEVRAVTDHFERTRPFVRYERTFLRRL